MLDEPIAMPTTYASVAISLVINLRLHFFLFTITQFAVYVCYYPSARNYSATDL